MEQKYAYYTAYSEFESKYIIGTIKCTSEEVKKLTFKKIGDYLNNLHDSNYTIFYHDDLDVLHQTKRKLYESFSLNFKGRLDHDHNVNHMGLREYGNSYKVVIENIDYEDL